VRGGTLTGTPAEARQALVGNGPISVAPVGDAELTEHAQVIDGFSVHDALTVASHRARDTEAIVTSDGVIRDAGYEAIWE
jgi:hypothetical protein